MAVIDKKGGIHGKAGSVIYRTYKGKDIIQGLPKRKKQTLLSMESASEFGLSSSTARVMREAFQPLYLNNHDGGFINRFNSVIYRCVQNSKTKARGDRDIHDGDLTLLEGLEFNQTSKFKEVFRVNPEISRNEEGQIRVVLPEIVTPRDIHTPFNSNKASCFRLRFVLLAFNYRQSFYKYLGVRDVNLESKGTMASRELVFDEEVPAGCFLVLAAAVDALIYNIVENRYESMKSKDFCPACLIAAFPSEEEAENGYGEKCIREEYRLAAKENRAVRIIPISGYCGDRMLDRMRSLGLRKNQRTAAAVPKLEVSPDNFSFAGKTVRF